MNIEKRYKVSVRTPNRFLFVKNKVVRTPTDFIILENEITKIKTKLNLEGISNYSIDLILPEKKKEEKTIIIENKETEVKKEETPIKNSILSNLLNS